MASPVKKRANGSSSCPYHEKKDVIYICENCENGTLACSECVTTVHRTHRLEKLGNAIPWKKEQVLRHIDATETHKLPAITKDISTIDMKLLENKKNFQDLITDTKKHGAIWKENIDSLVEKNIKLFTELEKQNAELLLKHKCELLAQCSDISDMLQNYHDTLQNGSHVEIFDIEIHPHKKHLFPETKTVHFKQQTFSMECLEHVFGSVEVETVFPLNPQCHDNVRQQDDKLGNSSFLKPQQTLVRRNSTGHIKERMIITKKPGEKLPFVTTDQNFKGVRHNSLPDQTIKTAGVKKSELKPVSKTQRLVRRHSTTSTIKTSTNDTNVKDSQALANSNTAGHGGSYSLISPLQLVMFDSQVGSIDYISPTNKDQAWVCKYNNKVIKLLDLMGDTQEEILSDSGITGIGVAPATGRKWLCCLDRGIREVMPCKSKPNQRKISIDCSTREETFPKSKLLQRQRSSDGAIRTGIQGKSKLFQRQSSFDSRMSEQALQTEIKSVHYQSEEKIMDIQKRKSVIQHITDTNSVMDSVEPTSAILNNHTCVSNTILPVINVLPPDSESEIVCIFDKNGDSSEKSSSNNKEYLSQSNVDHQLANQEMVETQEANCDSLHDMKPEEKTKQRQDLKKATPVRRKAVMRFYVKDTPWCICVTVNNSIVIGLENFINTYTTWGQIIRQINREGWYIYNTPRITSLQQMVACPITHNIAVMGHGQEETQHIFIMDSELNLKYCYSGEKEPSDEMSAISTSPFSAVALCYDSAGNLVVADGNNKCIILISGKGTYIKTLHQDTWTPQALGIQTDNTLWAAFCLSYNMIEVKLLAYTE